MVSYYNHPFAMYQKNHSSGSNLPYSASPSAAWYSSNYHHQPPNAAQFLDPDGPPQHMYHHYAPHMLPQPSPDWGHDNYTSSPQNGSLGTGSSSGLGNSPGAAAFLSLNQAASAQNGSNDHHHMNDAIPSLPSPPVTVHSGSDMSSPGAPSSSPQIPSRPTPVKSPYEWMKKPSYQSQPNPGKISIQFNSFIFISVIILKLSNVLVSKSSIHAAQTPLSSSDFIPFYFISSSKDRFMEPEIEKGRRCSIQSQSFHS